MQHKDQVDAVTAPIITDRNPSNFMYKIAELLNDEQIDALRTYIKNAKASN